MPLRVAAALAAGVAVFFVVQGIARLVADGYSGIRLRGLPGGRWVAGTMPGRVQDPSLVQLAVLAGLPAEVSGRWQRRRWWMAVGAALLAVASGWGGWFFPVLAGFGGWYAPRFYLSRLAARRQQLLQRALPGLLERLALASEAGLNLRQSLRVAAERSHGPLGELMQRVLARLDLGLGLAASLKPELAGIAPGPLRLVLLAIAKGERLGASLKELSQEQAALARRLAFYELQRAVEALPLKLTLCGLCFLFPPLFVVLLVPTLLTLFRSGW